MSLHSSFCVRVLDFRFDAAGAGEAPATQGFVDGEQSGHDKNQAQPQHIIHENNARDQAERAGDAARNATVALNVGPEEIAHEENLAQGFSVASRAKLRQNNGVDLLNLDSNQLWASVLWGGIGGGYIIYGWRQKSGMPLLGGVVMSLACFLPALPMTLISLAAMVAVYWLMKQGY